MVLADLLGIEVHAAVVDGRVQSLLLRILRDGGQFLSVNLYDKLPKALQDAAAAGFQEWRGLGFALKTWDGRRVSFLQFLQSRPKKRGTEQVARTARAKVLAVGLDPDIPLAAYQVFYNQRHIMGFTPDLLDAMNRAIDKADAPAVLALMQASGETVGKDTADLGHILAKMMAGSHVPAVVIAPVGETKKPSNALPTKRLRLRSRAVRYAKCYTR